MKEKLLSAQEETNQQMTAKLSEPERLLLFRILKDLREIEIPESDVLTVI
jgi:hypothetical protein